MEKAGETPLAEQRASALRFTSVYSTVSGAAVLVIAGVVAIDLRILERRKIWIKRHDNTLEQGGTTKTRNIEGV